MLKEKNYFYKIKTATDILLAHYLISSEQIEGKLLKEQDNSENIWLKYTTRIDWYKRPIKATIDYFFNTDSPLESIWAKGIPATELIELSSVDIFKEFTITSDSDDKLADEIIILVDKYETFVKIVKSHIFVNQGKIHYTKYEEYQAYFFLKVKNPSTWVIEMLLADTQLLIFNNQTAHSGLFIESGYKIAEFEKKHLNSKFQLKNHGLILLQKNGNLISFKPTWKPIESIIKYACESINEFKIERDNKITLPLTLRKYKTRMLEKLWKITDSDRFKAIFANQKPERFKGYFVWFDSNNDQWIIAISKDSDRGLARILSDTFAAYVNIGENIYVPVGTMIHPKLSKDKFTILFNTSLESHLCFESYKNDIRAVVFTKKQLVNMQDYVFYLAEQAEKKASQNSTICTFDICAKTSKKISIEVTTKNKTQKTRAQKQNKLKDAKREKKISDYKLNLNQKNNFSESNRSKLIREIIDIDKQLMKNSFEAPLWQRKSEISNFLNIPDSRNVSFMTAAILYKNTSLLINTFIEYIKNNSFLKEIFDENINELKKGRILANIRNSNLCAEYHYAALIIYSIKFDDFDLFESAIDLMRSAFNDENNDFFVFNKLKLVTTDKTNSKRNIQLLKDCDMPRIKGNYRAFMEQIRRYCCSISSYIISTQYLRMLRNHLSEKSYQKLLNSYKFNQISSFNEFLATKPTTEYLNEFFIYTLREYIHDDNFDFSNSSVVQRWLKLIDLNEIKDVSLKDFFTGNFFKPPFLFFRRYSNGKKTNLSSIKWIYKLNKIDFPDGSDGKSLAKSIYKRFLRGKNDWDDFFDFSQKVFNMHCQENRVSNKTTLPTFQIFAESQRLLLLMVAEYGPLPEFEKYILPLAYSDSYKNELWDIYIITMYCDIYRLRLAYKKPIDEQRFFYMLTCALPHPVSLEAYDDEAYTSFIQSVEWVILSLLLTSSDAKRYQLERILIKAGHWLQIFVANHETDKVVELLNVFILLEMGTLTSLVPESIKFYQLNEQRKAIWINHAFEISANREKYWAEYKDIFQLNLQQTSADT